MKKYLLIFSIICIASVAMAQENPVKQYDYYNNGFNFMLELDATINGNMKFVGPSFTFGCQSNSNIFWGGGIKFHRGKIITDYEADSDCGDIYFFGLIVPYLCFKYNILSMKRVTPYIDTRIGVDVCDGFNDGVEMNSTTMAGLRFGLRRGSRAINLAAGWSYADMRFKDEALGREHSFMLRLGVEI